MPFQVTELKRFVSELQLVFCALLSAVGMHVPKFLGHG